MKRKGKNRGLSAAEARQGQIEMLLAAAGYTVSGAAGQLSEPMRSALIAFQKAQGLPQTGEVDRRTLRRLRAALEQAGPGEPPGEPAPPARAQDTLVLTGRVVDEGALPRPGIIISLLDSQSELLAQALTDAAGQFTLTLTQEQLANRGLQELRFELREEEEPLAVIAQDGPRRVEAGRWQVRLTVAGPKETEPEPAPEEPGQTIQLKGDVRDEAGGPLAAVTVRAGVPGDQGPRWLAEALTGSEGDFLLELEREAVDQRLRLGVSDGDRQLLVVDQKGPNRITDTSWEVQLVVRAAEPEPDAHRYIVSGRLLRASGPGVAGVPVRALRRTLRREQLLGEALTDKNGYYTISYPAPGDTRRLDLQVRAGGPEEEPVAESELICGAARYEWVRLIVGNETYRGFSAFEKLLEALQPHLDGLSPAELTGEDADYLHCTLGEDRATIERLALAHRHAAQTGVTPAAYYGLLSQGLSTSLPVLLRQPPIVQRRALAAALAANTVPASVGGTLDTILTDLHQSAVRLALRQTDGAPSPVASLLGVAGLQDAQQQELVSLHLRHEGDRPAFWESVRQNPAFQQDGLVEQLQSTLQLGTLTGGNTALVQRLQQEGLQQPADLVGLGPQQLLGMVAETGVPDFIPGETEAARAEYYAGAMSGLLQHAFPSETVVAHLQQAPGTSQELLQFFQANPNFSFDEPLTPYLDNGAPLAELQPLQRLYRIAPPDAQVETVDALLNGGISSSYDVLRMGAQRFESSFSPSLGAETTSQLFAAAQQTVASTLLLATNYRPSAVLPRVISAVDSTRVADTIPTLGELFGPLDFCKCEHCRSVYSPAAYLVDLLEFLRQQPADGGTALDLLFTRRPDIGDTELSCANTNTVLPFIDLANEVLENAVLGGQKAFQTTWTATELAANAEHFTDNEAAYDDAHLAGRAHPFSLPFNLWLEEVRVYLGHFQVALPELMRVFQQPGLDAQTDPADPLVQQMAAERLGLSPAQRRLATGATTLTSAARWGMSGSNWEWRLSAVPTFLQQAGLDFQGLLALLDVRFVNTDGSLAVAFQDPCTTEGARLAHLREDAAGVLQTEPVQEPTFERAHRFLRLQRSSGWEMAELDELLVSLGMSDLDDQALVVLAQAHTLWQQLDVPPLEMAAWWGPISTRVDEEDETDRSLYEQIFLDHTVLNPVDEAFLLNGSRDELLGGGSETLGAHTATLLAALSVDDQALALLLDDAGLGEGDALNLDNLSALYRRVRLAEALDLAIADFVRVVALTGRDPFADTLATLTFVEEATFIAGSEFSPELLDYLLRDLYEEGAGTAPTEGEIDAVLDALAGELVAISESYAVTEDVTGETTAAWLALVLEAELVDTAMAILDGSSPLSEAEQNDFILNTLSLFLNDVGAAQLALVGPSPLLAGQTRFEYLLARLGPYLEDMFSAELVAEQLAEELDLEAAVVTPLLEDYLTLPADSTTPLLDAFLDLDAEATSHDAATVEGYRLLHKVALLLTTLDVAADELPWIFETDPDPGWLDPAALLPAPAAVPFDGWRRLVRLFELRHQYAAGDDDLFDLLQLAHDGADPALFVEELSLLTGWDEAGVEHLVAHFGLSLPGDATDERFYARLDEAFALLNRLGMSAAEVAGWQVEDDLAAMRETARQVKSAVKAVYDEEAWPAVAAPLRDVLREKQRDALVDYLVATVPQAKEAADLYDYLLIDVEMNACMDTSRIKQALGSVQLFVQRALMNLEPDVELSEEAAEQWVWMKNYRVWEANRKVFLTPENWIYPELRSDKSHLFEELESALLQDEVTERTAEDALHAYLRGLDEIANLEVRALYHQVEGQPEDDDYTDVLHVIARTAGMPHRYFYRWLEDGRVWSAWERVEVNIEGDHLLAFVWNRRLYLFWPQFKEQAQTVTTEAEEVSDPGTLSDLVIGALGKGNPGVLFWDAAAVLKVGKQWEFDEVDYKEYTSFIDWKNGLLDGSMDTSKVVAEVERTLIEFCADTNQSATVPNNLESQIADWLVEKKAYDNQVEDEQGQGEATIENEWEITLAWSEYRDGAWSAPTISEEAMVVPWLEKESFCLKPELTGPSWGDLFGIASASLNTATAASGDELQINLYWRKPTDQSEEVGSIGYSMRYYGRFTVTGCNGRVLVTPAEDAFGEAGEPWPTPWLTQLHNMRELEAPGFDVALELPAVADDGSIDHLPTLERTPGQFALAVPHQYRDFAYDDRFFYQDDTRSFLVSPQSALLYSSAASAISEEDHVTLGGLLPEALFVTEIEPGLGAFAGGGSEAASAQPAVPTVTRTTDVAPLVAASTLPVVERTDTILAYASDTIYNFETVYHPYVCRFLKELNKSGVEGLLRRSMQELSDGYFDSTYDPTEHVAEMPREEVVFDETDAYGLYNSELFFHAPLLIADRLLQNQQFEEAQQWLHFIFNPLLRADGAATGPERYWVYYPFYLENSGETLYEMMEALNAGDPEWEYQVEQWRKNPFDPHLIARLRPRAYMMATVMKYLDLLVAWGDHLFRRDTIESLTEATLLYVLAAAILGPRPEQLPETTVADQETYNSLVGKWDSFGNALAEVENYLGASTVVVSDKGIPLPTFDTLYFCIPENEKLLGYWDTVEDRLFKIRNCMNIEGVVRQLALFEPPIDPGLLVKAFAAGIDLGSVLDALYAPLPHYRFQFMLQKALEFTGDVRALGGALLAALEKKDAEALSLLRAGHEVDLLDAVRLTREQQVQQAEESLVTLNAGKALADQRLRYYEDLVETGLLPGEKNQRLLLASSLALESASVAVPLLSAALAPLARATTIVSGPPPSVGSTLEIVDGMKLAKVVELGAESLALLARASSTGSSIAGMVAGFARRKQEWEQQATLAKNELKQIDSQIAGAGIGLEIAQQELANHQKQSGNAQAVADFLEDKFTNEELYNWMVSELAALYFQAYNLAYDLARQTQRAYEHELGVTGASFVVPGYWDSLKKGLLSGERLAHDLRRMEAAYLEENRRGYEITKHISLRQLNPAALVTLQQTGACFFNIPEAVFDLDFPGHYKRRIKSVSLTIPAVTGPYTSVNATLTLEGNQIRMEPQTGTPDTNAGIFQINVGGIQSIATSSGQNDAGLFELNFRDERYLPFEGAGAVSNWHLELPEAFRPFDYETIADMVMTIRYTARDGGAAFKTDVSNTLAAELDAMALEAGRNGLWQVFSVRQAFPNEWQQFLYPPVGGTQTLTLNLEQTHFPFRFRDQTIDITSMFVLLDSKEGEAVGGTVGGTLEGPGGTDLLTFATVAPDAGGFGLLQAEAPSGGGVGPRVLTITTGAVLPAEVEDMILLCAYTI